VPKSREDGNDNVPAPPAAISIAAPKDPIAAKPVAVTPASSIRPAHDPVTDNISSAVINPYSRTRSKVRTPDSAASTKKRKTATDPAKRKLSGAKRKKGTTSGNPISTYFSQL
jgi:hypothetical protein